jgi:pimeloyl-ACP methyl ester carboxylesterase
MTHSSFPAQYFQLPASMRRLAFSAVGERNSPDVLLCLPGLLETRATFDPLLKAAESLHGLRVIGLDLCGRGDSDPMTNDKGYAMSVYLDDVMQFLKHEVMRGDAVMPRVHLLGTSMGGILSMYVASDKHLGIHSLTLNDIGLSLKWLSIYGLYDGMKQAGRMPEPHELAQLLHVSIGAVLAVQSPAHFDLPYRKDWTGMHFGHLLNHFKGLVRLVHGSESGVCLPEQVKEMRKALPNLEVLEVVNAKHPAPFNASVCDFVLQGLGVSKAHVQMHSDAHVQAASHAHSAKQPQEVALPIEASHREVATHAHAAIHPHPAIEPVPEHRASTTHHQPPARWWHKVIRHLNAKEK